MTASGATGALMSRQKQFSLGSLFGYQLLRKTLEGRVLEFVWFQFVQSSALETGERKGVVLLLEQKPFGLQVGADLHTTQVDPTTELACVPRYFIAAGCIDALG